MFGMKRFGSMMNPMIFMAPEGDGGAGGGAGAGGEGGDEKPLTRKEVEDMVGKSIGTHINSRGFQEKLRKGLASSDDIQGLRKMLEDSAAARSGTNEGQGGDGGQGNGGGAGGGGGSSAGGGMDQETKRALTKLQHDNEDLQKALRAMSDEKKATELKTRESEERGALKDALNGKVRPSLLPAAVALLYGERKVVGRDKDGGVVFKMKDRDNFDVEAAIDDGVKAWLETAEGKEYLPPVEAGGSGDSKSPRGERGNANGLVSTDKSVRSAAATNVLFG